MLGVSLVGYAISDHPFYGGVPGFGSVQALIATVGAGVALSAVLPVWLAERVLLMSVASLAMLGVGEVVAEAVLGPKLRPIFQPDERMIFKLIPDRTSVMTRMPVNGGTTVRHRINSAGFRGAELMQPGAAPRVVVYGDSFIHAAYTADDETFAASLGTQLSARAGRKVEVLNAGVSSYGPDQVSLRMEEELPRLHADLAIVAIFAGNDYGDLMRNKLFRIGPDSALTSNSWKLDPTVRDSFVVSQRQSILVRAVRSAVGRTRLSANGANNNGAAAGTSKVSDWNFLLEVAENEYRSFIVERNNVVTNTHVDYYSADISLTPNSESARYKIALMQAVLRRIHDAATRNRVPLVFLFIPHPVDVTSRYDDWGRVDLQRYPEYSGRNQTAPLEDAARSIGVPFVSLYDAYRTVDANALYFHGGDDHWNAAGQRMAAQRVSELLARTFPASRILAAEPAR